MPSPADGIITDKIAKRIPNNGTNTIAAPQPLNITNAKDSLSSLLPGTYFLTIFPNIQESPNQHKTDIIICAIITIINY